jgi:hypothetical protein
MKTRATTGLVIAAHAVLVILILLIAGYVLTWGPDPVGPGEIARRPDPLFDNLDAFVRGVAALVGLAGAILIAAGVTLWARTGRRTFGIAMDISIGAAASGALLSHDSTMGIPAIVLAIAAAAVMFTAPQPSLTRPPRDP